MNANNSIEHILYQCEGNSIVRCQSWEKVLDLCPGSLGIELNRMSKRDRTRFILNGFNCQYISEWKDTYNALIKFVYNAVSEYENCA